MATILLAGATGLVGSAVLDLAVRDERMARLVTLVRAPIPVLTKGLEQWIGRGDLLNGLREARVDGVICCLGTTMRNAGGDREKFIHVDKELVVGLARWGRVHGARCFAVVSAIGADASSSIFYNRVKGEMERELEGIGFEALHIFQPSILTGPRTEVRRGERIGIAATQALAPLMIGGLRRYRPMPHDRLARALVNAVLTGAPGVHRHTYAAITELAGRS